jgi:hypothetical protein
MGGFDVLAIDLHPAFVQFLSGQRPSFEKSGGPKPLVYAHFVHDADYSEDFKGACK